MAEESKSGACIALDIGDSTAKVAVFHGDRNMVIANEQGHRTTPCAVSFTEHELLVGEAAGRKAAKNARNTVLGWRWHIGKAFSDEELAAANKDTAVKVAAGADGVATFTANCKGKEVKYTGPQLAGLVFAAMRETAEGFLGSKVTQAVVTVPPTFDEDRREAVCAAVAAGGMDAIKLIDEPIAAAIGFGLDVAAPTTRRVLVFDLGGTSLDLTVLLVSSGLVRPLHHTHNENIGGNHFDGKIVELCQAEFKRRTSMVVEGQRSLARLRLAARIAKHALTKQASAHVEVDSLFEGIDFGYNVSRVRLEYQCGALLKQITRALETTLASVPGGLLAADVDDVLLVGGASRMPCVMQQVRKFFGGAHKLRTNVNAEEAVVLGAAMEMSLLATSGASPARMPSEAPVALAAATLRVAVSNSAATPVVARGTPLPCHWKINTSNAEDNQTSVQIDVLEGETPVAADCRKLGVLVLNGIAPARRGEAKLVLSVVAAANGGVQFTLTEQGGNRQACSLALPPPLAGGSINDIDDDDDADAVDATALCAPSGSAVDEVAYMASATAREELVTTATRLARDLEQGATYLDAWTAAQRAVLTAGTGVAHAFLQAHVEPTSATVEEWATQLETLRASFKAAALMAAAAGATLSDSSDDESSDDGSSDDEEGSSNDEGESSDGEDSSDDEMVAPPPGVDAPVDALD